MRRTGTFFIAMFLFISAARLTAQDVFVPEESRPQRVHELEREKTAVTIKTNVSGAEVFINGVYQGRTDVVIRNLVPGIYGVEVRKHGYESEFLRIRVKPGVAQEFYVRLRPVTGIIRLLDVPVGAVIQVDGVSYYSHSPEVSAGSHVVSVRKFGYEPFFANVTVAPHSVEPVRVVLEGASLRVDNFAASRERVNPEYSLLAGRTEFSFYVTAPATARLEITDATGKTVFSHDFPEFTTWNQSLAWDGTDSDGKPLPDGAYTATLVSPVSQHTVTVVLDRSLLLPLVSLTNSGGGIGTLPAILHGSEDYFLISGVLFSDFVAATSGGLYGIGTGGGVLIGAGKHVDFALSLRAYPVCEYDEMPLLFNFNTMFRTEFALGDTAFYTLGALLRYGFSSVAVFEPSGADFGAGLGWGIVNGFDFGSFYVGNSTEFILGTRDGNPAAGDAVLKNGLALSFRPVKTISFGLWCALNSSVTYDWAHALDFGAEFSFMPGASGFILTARSRNLAYFSGTAYFSAEFGLSYLF